MVAGATGPPLIHNTPVTFDVFGGVTGSVLHGVSTARIRDGWVFPVGMLTANVSHDAFNGVLLTFYGAVHVTGQRGSTTQSGRSVDGSARRGSPR